MIHCLLGGQSDSAAVAIAADIPFIAVGTPPDEDGHADLQYVLAVAHSIGRSMDAPRIVVTKSTVPVGTADKVAEAIRSQQQARGVTQHAQRRHITFLILVAEQQAQANPGQLAHRHQHDGQRRLWHRIAQALFHVGDAMHIDSCDHQQGHGMTHRQQPEGTGTQGLAGCKFGTY